MLYFVKTIHLKPLQCTIIKTIICETRNLSYGRNLPKMTFLQSKESEKRWQHSKCQRANFHSTQKLQLSVSSLMGICSVIKLSIMFSGNYARRWWLSLNPLQRQELKAWYWKRRNVFYGSLSFFSLVLLIYYVTNLERDPIEKRRRFIIFNKHQQATFGDGILISLLKKYKNEFIPPHDPVYKKIERTLQNLIKSNEEIFKNRAWSVNVVNVPLPNAVVLPDGSVIVFSGILELSQNEDQLTFILAHEMSHVLLLHMVELCSYNILETVVFAIPLFFIWACFSTWKAFFLYLGSGFLYKVFFLYPYRRRLELEADKVGFQLSARSCIDLKEVLIFWENMAKYSDLTGESDYEISFLMSHPNHRTRRKELARQMPKALDLQDQVGCLNFSLIELRKNSFLYLKKLKKYIKKSPYTSTE